ncbi:hypothetical protein JCM15519_07240 [Fundidesulfovibrio butyratiphilus]
MIDLNSYSSNAVSERVDWHINTAIDREAQAEPKRTYLGASILGDPCERAVQFYAMQARQDRVPTGHKHDIFARGHWIESLMIRRLRGAGFLLADVDPRTGQQFECSWPGMGGQVMGHPDGMLLHWLGEGASPVELPAIWECKGLGAKWWKKGIKDGLRWAFPRYFGQVQLLMGGFNLPRTLFTSVNADTMERHHVVVPFDQAAYDNLLARAARVFLAIQAQKLLPRGYGQETRMECRMCNFAATCWATK